MRGRGAVAKRKPCAVPLCPAWRKAGAYLCAAHAKEQTSPKAHKFHAVPTTIDAIRFDSKAEARRWQELQLLVKAGQIEDLERQPVFALHAASTTGQLVEAIKATAGTRDTLVGHYRGDFAYLTPEGRVVEDVKGLDNALSRWKRKHVRLQYGIDVILVR